MTGLVEFLRARLNEDEAAAKAAPGESWNADADGCCVSDVCERCEGDAALHIARHDPARVLREVEAKRAILALADDWDREVTTRRDLRDSMATEGNRSYQEGFADGLASRGHQIRCALAGIYRDHDGAWRP